MKTPEMLLGYDLREEITSYYNWPDDRKERYLLTQNIQKPLSVDEYVWTKVKTTDGERNYLNLWKDLDFLKKSDGKRLAKQGELVAITIVYSKETKDTVHKYFMKPDVKAYSKKSTWKLLGYDIGDPRLLSFLMNYGHGKMAVSNLFNKWGNYLNNYHLFDELNYALLYKDFCYSLYQEAKPFFIFGIYTTPNP